MGRQRRGRAASGPALLRCALLAAYAAAAHGSVASQNVTLVQLRGRQPENRNLGQQYRKDAEDYAWRIQGEATEARASTHEVRARDTLAGTKKGESRTAAARAAQASAFPPVESERVTAAEAAEGARAWEAKAKAILDATYDKAFAASKASAEATAANLEAEAKAYYDELVANFFASAAAKPNKRQQAIDAAAAPYIGRALQTGVVVFNYNEYVKALIAGAKGCVKMAFKMANLANVDQEVGNGEMAMRKMIYAHDLLVKADKMEAGAKGVYKLAYDINSVIPTLSQSAEEAALAVANTWPHNGKYNLLDIGGKQRLRRKNPFGSSKVQPETPMGPPSEKDVEAATADLKNIDQSLSSLDSDLAALDKRLAEMKKKAMVEKDKAFADTNMELAAVKAREGVAEARLAAVDRQLSHPLPRTVAKP